MKIIMQNLLKNNFHFLCIVFISFFFACTKDPRVIDINGSEYPLEVSKIILSKCAIEGCHNNQSKEAAAGLSLSTWQNLFEGTNSGSAVIPFWHKQSTLFLFCNTFPDLGVSNIPTMPVNGPNLSRDEVLTIKNWIDKGAPRSDGYIMFSDNIYRSKYYIPNQGCDIVTVIDEKTSLPMRYIPVGNSASAESPHQIRVAPNNKYWYVISTRGNSLQKYDASNDSYVGEIILGYSNWNTFIITNDSKYAFAVDWSSSGQVYLLNLEDLKIELKYPSNLFIYPHGIALSNDNKQLYVMTQFGNYTYKLTFEPPYSFTNPNFDNFTISLDGNPPSNNFSLDPHDIVFTSDGSKYLITCQRTNELRIFNSINDQIIATVPIGFFPQEVVFDKKRNFAYVSCPEDTLTFSGKRGCISIVDLNTNTLLKKIYSGHQPHGLAIDFAKDILVIANRNASSDGPAPHHTSDCGGRNGYLSFIDLKSLELIKGKKIEVAADPYFVAIRE